MSSSSRARGRARCRRPARRRRPRPASRPAAGVVADADRPRRPRSRPCASLVACGYCSLLTKSLTVISPAAGPARRPAAAARPCAGAAAPAASSRGDADRRGDQRHRGHHLVDRSCRSRADEAHVAVGDDADQPPVAVDDRQAGDPERAAAARRARRGWRRGAGDRVGDHAGLGALDQVDLIGLVLDRQVAVQHADAALAGHRDGHPGLGDGVHRGGEQRHVQRRCSRVSRVVVSTSLGHEVATSPGSSSTSSKVRPSGTTRAEPAGSSGR